MIFSTSSSFSVNKTGVLEKSTDFATVHVSYGTSPNSGSLKEYDVICMNPDGFAIYCNITLSYGIFSPFTDSNYIVFLVYPNGYLADDYVDIVAKSYGRILLSPNTYVLFGTNAWSVTSDDRLFIVDGIGYYYGLFVKHE